MIPVLLYPLLCTYILPVPSLEITVPIQPHPIVNGSTSVLLAWSPDDPSHFFIAVQQIFSQSNVTSFIQQVVNFTATRNVSAVFESAGKTFIEAIKASPTAPNTNVTFAQSEPFQVDEGLTSVIPVSYTRDAPGSSSATVSSTASTLTLIAPATTPSKDGHKTAIIAGVVCGAFLLTLITTILLIWRCRKRRAPPPEGAFPTNLENDRQHIIRPYLKRLSIPPLRAFFHDEREHINHYPDVPPPPYSPLVTSE
ncbi:hypothetical protein EV421DRAFT_1911027 [Armillaria borealis]|uniref:Mid2 domain-containing protein n=1 Tax=Armillaria borealis TaxID=47425 RepID=A0AA39IXI6_9AGAR|nr:hypothetical protein EV421DRAFT_1911027 [Armillaria borealis]